MYISINGTSYFFIFLEGAARAQKIKNPLEKISYIPGNGTF